MAIKNVQRTPYMKLLWMLLIVCLPVCLEANAQDSSVQNSSIKGSSSGFLYPGNPDTIRARLNFVYHHPAGPIYQHDFECPAWGGSPFVPPALAIICPHADWSVSGPAAEQAYRAVRNQQVKRIIILAAAHHQRLHGAAVPKSGSFQTPVGNLEVDRNAVSKLRRYPLFVSDDRDFASDFPLEMQLPYIRYTFGKVPIVPIMIYQLKGESEVRQLAEILRKNVCATDLVVVSADFTHYGAKYNFQPFKNNVMQNIRDLDRRAYGYLARADLKGFMNFKQATGDTICGYLPCCVLLAMMPEGSKGCLLAYDNCDNRLGTLSRYGFSVSYMGIVFSGPKWFAKQKN